MNLATIQLSPMLYRWYFWRATWDSRSFLCNVDAPLKLLDVRFMIYKAFNVGAIYLGCVEAGMGLPKT